MTNKGGPRDFVMDGVNGYVARDLDEFVKYAEMLIDDPALLARLKVSSIEFAITRSWDSVFETVYSAYSEAKDYLDKVKRTCGKKERKFFTIPKIASDEETE